MVINHIIYIYKLRVIQKICRLKVIKMIKKNNFKMQLTKFQSVLITAKILHTSDD